MVSFFLFHSQDAKALKAKKEEGNKAFKDGNFEAAYELYSEALTIDPNNIKTNAKLYCNRATVGSKVSNMTLHLQDFILSAREQEDFWMLGGCFPLSHQ